MTTSIAEKQLLKKATDLGLDKNLDAIAVEVTLVDGTDASSSDVMLDPCFVLKVVPNPVLDIKLRSLGATRRGALSWTVGLGEESEAPRALRALVDSITPGILWPHAATHTNKGPRDLYESNMGNHLTSLLQESRVHWQAIGALDSDNGKRAFGTAHPRTGAGFGAVTVEIKNRTAWVRAYTHQLVIPGLPEVKLNQRVTGGDTQDPTPVRAREAVAAVEWLAGAGVIVLDESKIIAKTRKQMAATIVAHPTPGQPAIAQVTMGRSVRAFFPSIDVPDATEGAAFSSGQIPATTLASSLKGNNLIEPVLHPGVADIAKMSIAQPHEDSRLKSYQTEAVGLHLSTELGFLNACSPGMGKTVMALVPMSVRAKTTKFYRGLVVAEANVRNQWTKEAAKWFPEAKVVTITASKDTGLLAKALAEVGTGPLLVITSYAMVNSVKAEMDIREQAEKSGPVYDYSSLDSGDDQLGLFGLDTILSEDDLAKVVTASGMTPAPVVTEEPEVQATLGKLLLGTRWHDLIADEAEVLRGTGKQASAMWELRRNSGTAVALTGTPINRGLDDLGRLIAWCRNDERLFRGVKLSEQFDLSDSDELARFAEAMGPVIFRRDTSEVAHEMPTITPKVIKLRPSAAEKSLADAARLELKRVYTELVAAISQAESLDPDNPAFATAREELTKARGAWLGGTQLARMAASDPAALLSSQSAGAALLAGQGLIAAATQVTGTKRRAIVADVVARITDGEAVLVFTEFATVAHGLIADLEAAGVKVGSILGGGGKKRDRMVEQFQDGELDVLISTSSGERGLNLQRANTIVHYDLPWTPKGVIQRTGRAHRLESANKHVTVVFPLMEDTVEEKVASMVVSRAIDSMRALDTSRGVDSAVTEMGLALGGLAEAVSDTRAGRKEGAELMEICAVLVG